MAFLDDIVISTPEPDRVTEAHTIVAEELWSHARIQVHFGKTQVCNRGGIEPAGMEDLTRAARMPLSGRETHTSRHPNKA